MITANRYFFGISLPTASWLMINFYLLNIVLFQVNKSSDKLEKNI